MHEGNERILKEEPRTIRSKVTGIMAARVRVDVHFDCRGLTPRILSSRYPLYKRWSLAS